jgi:AraC-like DNA-binding protein
VPAVSEPEPYEFATADPELAHAMIHARYAENGIALLPRPDDFELRIRGSDTDRFTVERMQQSAAFRASTSPSHALFAARASAGRCAVGSGRDDVRFGAGETVLVDPARPLQVVLEDVDYEVVRLDLGATTELAAGMSGLDPEAVRFWSTRPVSGVAARQWLAVTEHVRGLLLGGQATDPVAGPLARAEAFRLLATTLVLTFPNSALEALEDPARPGPGSGEPAVVRRAVDFIERHAGEPIDVGDIATAAGIGPRGLQHSFRKHLGTTPRTRLLTTRLERAHRDLREGDPSRGETVAAVARRWGFTHLGRFGAAYRDRFGCAPSETLRD